MYEMDVDSIRRDLQKELEDNLDRVIEAKVNKFLKQNLEEMVRAIVRAELKPVQDEEKQYNKEKNVEEREQLKKEENKEKIYQFEKEKYKEEVEKALLRRLSLNLEEIFDGKIVESEDIFKMLLIDDFNFFKRYKSEKEKEIKQLREKIKQDEEEYKKLGLKIKTLQSQYEENLKKLSRDLDNEKIENEKLNRVLNNEKAQNEKLKEENIALQITINNNKNEIKNILADQERYRSEIQAQIMDLKKDIHRQQEIITENENEKNKLSDLYNIAKFYNKYMSISQQTRDKLENLIRTEDIGSFTTCCYQLSTMDDIWEFVNLELRKGNLESEDCKILGEIFTYFIQQKNKMYADALYRVYVPEKGEYFDATKHLDVDRNGADKIKEVIFPGYGSLENKTDSNQPEEERKIKKMKKLPIVKTM